MNFISQMLNFPQPSWYNLSWVYGNLFFSLFQGAWSAQAICFRLLFRKTKMVSLLRYNGIFFLLRLTILFIKKSNLNRQSVFLGSSFFPRFLFFSPGFIVWGTFSAKRKTLDRIAESRKKNRAKKRNQGKKSGFSGWD